MCPANNSWILDPLFCSASHVRLGDAAKTQSTGKLLGMTFNLHSSAFPLCHRVLCFTAPASSLVLGLNHSFLLFSFNGKLYSKSSPVSWVKYKMLLCFCRSVLLCVCACPTVFISLYLVVRLLLFHAADTIGVAALASKEKTAAMFYPLVPRAGWRCSFLQTGKLPCHSPPAGAHLATMIQFCSYIANSTMGLANCGHT